MQEIILVLIPALIVSFFFYEEKRSHEKQLDKLFNELKAYRKAVMAKNLAEYSASEFMESPEETVEIPDEIMDTSELDENEFKRMIANAGEEEIIED